VSHHLNTTTSREIKSGTEEGKMNEAVVLAKKKEKEIAKDGTGCQRSAGLDRRRITLLIATTPRAEM
jgi:hypothetical protein